MIGLTLYEVPALLVYWGSIAISFWCLMHFKTFKKFIKWLLWDFSGLRFVWEKIRPPAKGQPSERPPATLMIWAFGIFGIYIAVFGLASQRYENRIDIIENRANAILNHLSTQEFKKAFGRIPEVQKMKAPLKPDILQPLSVFKSLLHVQESEEIVHLLKETIEIWKDSLESVVLNNVNLRGALLIGANFSKAELNEVNLEYAVLFKANLSESDLTDAVLRHTDLSYTDLTDTLLTGADLEKAILTHAILKEADLQDADLTNSKLNGADLHSADLTDTKLNGADLHSADLLYTKNLRVEQLCMAKTLYNANLESKIVLQIKNQCPQLLENPK